jgi:hypothetical protein
MLSAGAYDYEAQRAVMQKIKALNFQDRKIILKRVLGVKENTSALPHVSHGKPR